MERRTRDLFNNAPCLPVLLLGSGSVFCKTCRVKTTSNGDQRNDCKSHKSKLPERRKADSKAGHKGGHVVYEVSHLQEICEQFIIIIIWVSQWSCSPCSLSCMHACMYTSLCMAERIYRFMVDCKDKIQRPFCAFQMFMQSIDQYGKEIKLPLEHLNLKDRECLQIHAGKKIG